MSLSIVRATDPSFAPYGRVLKGDFSSAVSYLLNKTPMPPERNLYVRDEEAFRKLPLLQGLRGEVFGEMAIEAGYCNGYNSFLNALESHACPEIDIAATDLVLLLALPSDVVDGMIDSLKVRGFLLKAGEAVVLSPYTFHYSPCKLSAAGFKCGVILLEGTNMPLAGKAADPRLWMVNKWLYAHPDSLPAKQGAYIGIKGMNLEVKC